VRKELEQARNELAAMEQNRLPAAKVSVFQRVVTSINAAFSGSSKRQMLKMRIEELRERAVLRFGSRFDRDHKLAELPVEELVRMRTERRILVEKVMNGTKP
jgi:hypothetical protein